jgi:glycerol transport system ATP-binding protein
MSLTFEHLTKKVGKAVHIDAISMNLEAGSFNILLGRTLAGKTTLMRLVAGLDSPTAGRILLDGHDITNYPVQKRKVAMVYQQFINYPSLTVYNNIASPLRLAKLEKKEIDRRVREAAEIMRIDTLLDRLPDELSGGQQQRTAMARALVKDAELLLFDEPLANLDYKLREQLRVDMRQIFKRRQAVAIYATTEPVEALTLGGNIAILDEGRLLQVGPTLQVYHNPASVRVGEVFSDPPINLIAGVRENDILLLADNIRLPLKDHLKNLKPGPYQFGVRANHLYIRSPSPTAVAIQATTKLAEINGSETYIHVHHNGVEWVIQEDGIYEFHMGEPLTVYMEPRHLFAFDAGGGLATAPSRRVLAEV